MNDLEAAQRFLLANRSPVRTVDPAYFRIEFKILMELDGTPADTAINKFHDETGRVLSADALELIKRSLYEGRNASCKTTSEWSSSSSNSVESSVDDLLGELGINRYKPGGGSSTSKVAGVASDPQVFWSPEAKYCLFLHHMSHDADIDTRHRSNKSRGTMPTKSMDELHWIPVRDLISACRNKTAISVGDRHIRAYNVVEGCFGTGSELTGFLQDVEALV